MVDTDCQIVANRLNVSIEQLLSGSNWEWVSDKFQDLVIEFLSSVGVVNGDFNQSLLDVLKKSTFVTKTRNPYGHHVYWLSKQQRKAIGSASCKKGFEFEIKTDETLGLCTLPGSAHKEDPEFRYSAVGITDHILTNEILYDLLVEMFKDCLVNGKVVDDNTTTTKEEKKNHNSNKENKKRKNKDRVIKNQIILSPSIIKATAGYLSEFVAKGYRNNFYVCFSGMLFHSRISEESAAQIIAGSCAKTNDEESRSRQFTLTATYEKGFDGEEIEGPLNWQN